MWCFRLSFLIGFLYFSLSLVDFIADGSRLSANNRFERISSAQGLSQSTVYSILQDRKGFLWFGTQDGLNRYDGYSFKIFNHQSDNPNSLSHNDIRALFEDQSGNIWIGTLGGGLDRYDPRLEQFTHFKHDTTRPLSLSDNKINTICADQEGCVWIGTGKGLDSFDPVSGQINACENLVYK